MSEINCYSCQAPLDFEAGQKLARLEECSSCYASLHVCKMCRFFDETAYNGCSEPMAPRIVEKDKANFCEFFKLAGKAQSGPSADDLKSAADALFKK